MSQHSDKCPSIVPVRAQGDIFRLLVVSSAEITNSPLIDSETVRKVLNNFHNQ